SGSGLTSAISNPFTINPGAPNKLVIATQPVSTTAGVAVPVVVQVQDANGNLTSASGTSVTLTSVPAGINTKRQSVSGVATFNPVLNLPNTYTVTATSTGLTSAISNPFTISVGAPAKLAFTTQPTNLSAGSTMTPVVVQIQDSVGNVVTGSNASVS